MRVQLAHDYMTQRGGAERVVTAWAKAMQPVGIATITANRATLADHVVPLLQTSWLDRAILPRRDPRLFLPLIPVAARSLPVHPDADCLLISTSGFAHGISSDLPRVTYWHTPARWLYAGKDYELGLSPIGRFAGRALRRWLLHWDELAMAHRSLHVCNSTATRERLKRAYGIDAEVVYPPVEPVADTMTAPEVPLPDNYYLTVGRARGYKNIGLVSAAAEKAGVNLVVVGDLPSDDGARPGQMALSNVTDSQLKWLYRHATALVSASREDFGLTPLEANLEGTPAIVLEAGGFQDSLQPGVNGRFFDREDVDSCSVAIQQFRASDYSADDVRAHASGFALSAHAKALQQIIDRALRGSSS